MSVTFGPVAENSMPTPAALLSGNATSTGRAERGGGGAARFEYMLVHSYEDAVDALLAHGPRARVIAGGQSLVPMMTLRIARPTALIDLNGIGREEPDVDGDHLVLPAMTRYSQVLASELVCSTSPLLAEAVVHVGNVRVRNRGTLGGGLAHGEATAEIGAVSLALGGEIVACGPLGSRAIRCEEFFRGFLTTCLEPGEVITSLRLPLARTREGTSFQEMTRRGGGVAVVGVAAKVSLDGDDRVRAVRLGLIGVADRPVAGEQSATSSLLGERPSLTHLATVAAAVAGSICPVSDVLASGSYRRRLARVLIRRALTEAVLRAGGRVPER